jgi:hypothetical protein
MNPKVQTNHKKYLTILRSLGPEGRLKKAFELSAFSKQLFLEGLRRRFPEKNENELISIYRDRIAQCHNRNY